MELPERAPEMTTKIIKGLEHLLQEERLRGLGLLSLNNKSFREILPLCISTQTNSAKKPDSSVVCCNQTKLKHRGSL